MKKAPTLAFAAATHIIQVMSDPDAPDVHSVIAGHLNLAMFLLFKAAIVDSGDSPSSNRVKSRAREMLVDLSLNLPE